MSKITEFDFRSGGHLLKGWLHKPSFSGSCCAVVSHGFNGYGNSPKWNFICSGLARAGFAAFRFSHRGCDTSEGDFSDTTVTSRLEDLRAAMNALYEETGARTFGLIGSSFGGATVLLSAADPRVSCCFTLAAPADFGFFDILIANGEKSQEGNLILDGREVKTSIVEDAAQYDLTAAASRAKNIFVLHGDCDNVIPVEHADRIYTAACEPKALLKVPDADHPFTEQRHQDIMLAELIAWFKKHLTAKFPPAPVDDDASCE